MVCPTLFLGDEEVTLFNHDANLFPPIGECKPKEIPPWENLIKRPKQQTY